METFQMYWLWSEDLKEEKNVTAPIAIIAVEELSALCSVAADLHKAVPLSMSRIGPQLLDPDPSDHPVAADILLREEPEEEEDEDESDGKDDADDDDADDDGYSE